MNLLYAFLIVVITLLIVMIPFIIKNKRENKKTSDNFNRSQNELQDHHMVYFDDYMYLPIQYHNNYMRQPNFKGKGNHSINELEDICERYKEHAHQQAIIKQNAMKHVIENKFNIKFQEND